MLGLTSFTLVLAAARSVAAQSVEFFYTETLNTCQFDGAYIQANDQTIHGGVCAYRRDVARVYGCPSPDPTCWTWAETCSSSGIGQTVCNRAGTVFCCNAVAGESCTQTTGQINVCISNFTSPNSGVSNAQANQVYLSAIQMSNVTATKQTADPTPFSTRQLGVSTATSVSSSASSFPASSTSSKTKSASGTQSTTTSTSATAAAQSTSGSNPAASQSSNSSISGGAIAGIVIGVIALLAVIGAIVFFVRRKKRNATTTSETRPLANAEMAGPTSDMGAYNASMQKKHGDFYAPGGTPTAPSELGNEGHGRSELSATGHHAAPHSRYELA